MSHTMISKLENWSLLDPKPVLYFDEYVYEWIAIWNGVYMPVEYSILICSSHFWNIPISNDMRHQAFLKLKKHQGISSWATEDMFKNADHSIYLYKLKMQEHLKSLRGTDKSTILQWFDKFFRSDK